MNSTRGYDSLDSKSRLRLIEAASELLGSEGYRAITARRVADRARLKPQLVHYYFRSMEDLVVAVFRHSTANYARLHERALASPHPLRAIWRLNSHMPEAQRMTEYMALAKQHPALREEMRRAGEEFRRLQIETAERIFAQRADGDTAIQPAALATLLSAIARNFVIEGEAGVSGGHAAMSRLVECLLDRYDPLEASTPDRASAGRAA
jgi:AcrR family transcriptional regulator